MLLLAPYGRSAAINGKNTQKNSRSSKLATQISTNLLNISHIAYYIIEGEYC